MLDWPLFCGSGTGTERLNAYFHCFDGGFGGRLGGDDLCAAD